MAVAEQYGTRVKNVNTGMEWEVTADRAAYLLRWEAENYQHLSGPVGSAKKEAQITYDSPTDAAADNSTGAPATPRQPQRNRS